MNNKNSRQPVTRWDLIDAIAKLYVIGSKSIGQIDDLTFQIDPTALSSRAGQIKAEHRQIGRHQRLQLKGCVSVSIRVTGLIITICNKPNSLQGSTFRQLSQRACRLRRKAP